MLWLSQASSLGGFVVFASFFSLSYLILKYARRAFFSPLSKFPGPKAAAATKLYEAHHHLVKDDWLENLESLHDQYGPGVRVGPNEIHFNDHEFSLKLHRRPDLMKCDNYYGLLDTLLGGLHLPHDHSKRKGIIQPLFGQQNLATFSDTWMNKHLRTLDETLAAAATRKEPVNMTYILWAFTNDIMFSYILDKDLGFQKSGDLRKTHDATRAYSAIDLASAMRSMKPLKKMFDVFPFLRAFSPLGWLDDVFRKELGRMASSDKEASAGDHGEHRSVLAQLKQQLGDDSIITQEAAQAVFIGNESLLSNITFALHQLMHSPESLDKLRKEFDTLDVGTYGREPQRDPRVLRLEYLGAACQESFRLSSPSWHRQPRQLNEPVEYDGKIIPPKTSISFTLKLLETDPVLFPEPQTFKPERWIGRGPEAQKARSSAVMFGTGTRTCLGQHIARQVLRKVLVTICYSYNISLWDGAKDAEEGYTYLVTYPKKGHEGFLKARITPRFQPVEEACV